MNSSFYGGIPGGHLGSSETKDEAVRVIVRLRPAMEQCLNPELEYIPPHQGICAEMVDNTTVKLIQLHYCTCEYCRVTYGAEVRTEHYTIRKDKEDKLFKFNHVFAEDCTQDAIFKDVESFVDAAIDGYASTILAYGPPLGGKTFTMTGNYYEAGIIPRSIDLIFDKLTTFSNDHIDNVWEIEMSYVEFYNNNFRNLLRDDMKPANTTKDRLFFGYTAASDTSSEVDDRSVSHPKVCNIDTSIIMHGDKIEIRESPIIGAFLAAPVIRYSVKTSDDAIALIAKGDKNRTFSTNSNNESTTRGHAIVTLYIETKLVRDVPAESYFVKGLLKLGKIHLVDLASGERVKDSNASGDSLVEAQHINRSLLALGEVLHALSVNAAMSRKRQKLSDDQTKADESGTLPSSPFSSLPPQSAAKLKDLHVPYFDSKFTHLLRDSFGGNGKSTMIVTIPPERQYYHQNVQALQFALRARKVLNFPEVNKLEITADVVLDPTSELSIIQQLKQKLLEPLMREAAKNGYRRAVNAPYSSIRPKSFNFIIKNMVVEDIPYVSFPLQPWLRVETAGVVHKTSKQQYYTNRATYTEEFNIEVDAQDYEEGEEVEVRVFSVIPYRHKWELGRTKFILAKSFPVMEEKIKLSFPFYQLVDDEIKQQGQLLISGITKPSFSSRASIFDMPYTASAKSKFQTPSKPLRPITGGPSTTSKLNSAMKGDNNTAVDLHFDANKKYVLAVKKFATADAHIDVQEGSDGSGNYKFYLEAKFGAEVVKTGSQSGKTRYRGKEKVATINFDDPNLKFDVNGGQLRNESIHLLLYVKPSNDSAAQVIGRVLQPVNSMLSKQGEDVVVDFHGAMRDVGNKVSGKVSFGLQLLPTSMLKKPVPAVDENLNQELTAAKLPDDLIFGWVRISSIEGVGLNTLKLLGKHARYIDNVEDPNFLETVKQDLMVVVEFGDKWASKTAILSDQEDCCLWNNANFKIFTSRDDLIREPVKFSVYNMRVTGKDRLVGTSVVPLHRLCDDKTLTIRHVSLPLKNRKGKTNGKLVVNGAVLKDKGDSWIPAVIVSCHHDGSYDVQYEDGETEPHVSKDLLIPHHRQPSTNHTVSTTEESGEVKAGDSSSEQKSPFRLGGKPKPRFVLGAKVEVQFGGRDLWYPATIAADHNNGFYDLDATYEIPKSNIHETLIRPIAISPVKTKPANNPNRVLFSVGEKLEANYKMKGKYYPATVWKVHSADDGSYAYDVDYESGVREYALTEDKIRPLPNTSNKVAIRTSSELDLTMSMKTPLSKLNGKSKYSSSPDMSRLLQARPTTPVSTPKHSPVPSSQFSTSRTPEKPLVSAASSANFASLVAAENTNRWESGLFEVGDRVEANYRQCGDYYPGFVQDVQDEKTYTIIFDGGEVVTGVDSADIRVLLDPNAVDTGDAAANEADSKYPFQLDDRVEANYRGIGQWYPGTIKRKRGAGLFDIQFDDGKQESKVYGDQIRVYDVDLDQGYKYQVGDNVEVNSSGAGYWYPAKILKHRGGGCYDVEFDDDHEKECFVVEKFLRFPPPSDVSEAQLWTDKPKFHKGDFVLVKSRSKAVEAQIKLYGDLQEDAQRRLDELFALLRQVEEEECHLQWAKQKTALQSKALAETKQDIDGILEGEDSFFHEEDPQIKTLQKQLHAQENAVEFARKLVSKQWGKVEDLRSSLQNEVTAISVLDKRLLSQSQSLTQANRSGLEEADAYSITEALDDVRRQWDNIGHAMNTSEEAIKWIVSARHNCEEETTAVSAADVVGKKLLEALVTKAQQHDDALHNDEDGDNSDSGYDAARHGVEVGYDGIYGEDDFNDDEEVTMVGYDNVKDLLKSASADRRDSVLSPKFEMEVNKSAKTMLGQILIKPSASSGKDALDMLHSTPRGLQRSFSRKRSSRGTVHSRLTFLGKLDDSQVVHGGSAESMVQLGYTAVSVLEQNGSKDLSFEFEVDSRRRSRRMAAPIIAPLRPMSPMEDPRFAELRRLIAEKKARAKAAELEYFRKNQYVREEELSSSVQASIDDFVQTFNLQDVLENKGSAEIDNYHVDVLDNESGLQQCIERRQECEHVALQAKQHAEQCEVKLTTDELTMSPDDYVQLLESTKLAYVEAWSRWEEAKFMTVTTRQCFHQLTHSRARRLKDLGHLRHKLKDLLQEYEELRIQRTQQAKDVLVLRAEVEERRQQFFAKKEQLERDSMAHERLNKRLNDVAFSSKLLARTTGGGGGSNSAAPTPKSSFRRGSSLYDGAKPVEDVNDLFADIGAIRVEVEDDDDDADSTPTKANPAAVLSPLKTASSKRGSTSMLTSPSFNTPRAHHHHGRRASVNKKGFFAFDPKEASQELAKQRLAQQQTIEKLHEQSTEVWKEVRFEDHFWFKSETVAFNGNVSDTAPSSGSADEVDNLPGSINGLELVNLEALLLAKTHMKKTIQLRADTEELLQEQLKALAEIIALIETENNNYTLAVQSLVSDSELLTQARHDIEIEVRHETSQVKAKTNLVHLCELKDKIALLRKEIDAENKVVQDEQQAYLQTLHTYSNNAAVGSPKQRSEDSSGKFNQEPTAKDHAMETANQQQALMLAKEQCLHDEAIRRIAKEFRAQLLQCGGNNNNSNNNVTANAVVNSSEIDHNLLSQVNQVYEDEHADAAAAIFHAEQQVKSLEEAKAHAKHEQQAFQRQKLDFLKSLFTAAATKYQESEGKMKGEDADIAQTADSYEGQRKQLEDGGKDVTQRMASLQDTLTKLKRGSQYLHSKEYKQLMQSYERALSNMKALQLQRVEEEKKAAEIRHYRHRLKGEVQQQHDTSISQIAEANKSYDQYEHQLHRDYDGLVSSLSDVLDGLTTEQSKINVVRTAIKQEKANLQDIQDKIMAEEREELRLMQLYAEELRMKIDLEAKRSKCQTGLGSILVSSHNFSPQSASSHRKKLQEQQDLRKRLQHLLKTIKPFPWKPVDSFKGVQHEEKKMKLSALGYADLDEARSKVILTKEVMRFDEHSCLFDIKSCPTAKKILPHPPHSGYLPLYMASKAKAHNMLLSSAPSLAAVTSAVPGAAPITPTNTNANSDSIGQGFVQNSKKSLTRTFSMMGSKNNSSSSSNGFGDSAGNAASSSAAMASIAENETESDSELAKELRRLEGKLQASNKVEVDELVPFEHQIDEELLKMTSVIDREHDSFDTDQLAKDTVLDDEQLAAVLDKIRAAGVRKRVTTTVDEEHQRSKKTVQEDIYRIQAATVPRS